jgi:hypothetical protein
MIEAPVAFNSPEDLLRYILKRALALTKKGIKVDGDVNINTLFSFIEEVEKKRSPYSVLSCAIGFLKTNEERDVEGQGEIEIIATAILASEITLSLDLNKMQQEAFSRGTLFSSYNAANYKKNHDFRVKETSTIIEAGLSKLSSSDFASVAEGLINKELPKAICRDLFKDISGVFWRVQHGSNAKAVEATLNQLDTSVVKTFEKIIYGDEKHPKNRDRFGKINFNEFVANVKTEIFTFELNLSSELRAKTKSIFDGSFEARVYAAAGVAQQPMAIAPNNQLQALTEAPPFEKPNTLKDLLASLLHREKGRETIRWLDDLAKSYLKNCNQFPGVWGLPEQNEDDMLTLILDVKNDLDKMDMLDNGIVTGTLYVGQQSSVEALLTIYNALVRETFSKFGSSPNGSSFDFLNDKEFKEKMFRNIWFSLRLFKPVLEGRNEKLKAHDIARFANFLLSAIWYLPKELDWDTYREKHLLAFLKEEIEMSESVIASVFAEMSKLKSILDKMNLIRLNESIVGVAVNVLLEKGQNKIFEASNLIRQGLKIVVSAPNTALWSTNVEMEGKVCAIPPAVLLGLIAFHVLFNAECDTNGSKVTGKLANEIYALICAAIFDLAVRTKVTPEIIEIRQLLALLPIIKAADLTLEKNARTYLEEIYRHHLVEDLASKIKEKIPNQLHNLFPHDLLKNEISRLLLKKEASGSAGLNMEIATLLISAIQNGLALHSDNDPGRDDDKRLTDDALMRSLITLFSSGEDLAVPQKDGSLDEESLRKLCRLVLSGRVIQADREREVFSLPSLLTPELKVTLESEMNKIRLALGGGSRMAISDGVSGQPKSLTDGKSKPSDSVINKLLERQEMKILVLRSLKSSVNKPTESSAEKAGLQKKKKEEIEEQHQGGVLAFGSSVPQNSTTGIRVN